MVKITAEDVASYFLVMQEEEAGEMLTNLKLQKLCYYAQGFFLAIRGEPLFDDRIEAWEHGPVVVKLWHKYKENAANPIEPPESFNLNVLPAVVREILNEVYEVYGQFSAWKLRNLTHAEDPWKVAHNSSDKEISHDSMKEFFLTLVEIA